MGMLTTAFINFPACPRKFRQGIYAHNTYAMSIRHLPPTNLGRAYKAISESGMFGIVYY
ncbi:hypothetical protein BGW80DRAFT_1328343 [Lactifluus volemus]|nr:hypothetical protein BGW80DRAFT_1328343 [Lactifluus volemus]